MLTYGIKYCYSVLFGALHHYALNVATPFK